jgi:PEP-CTERM motif
MRLFRCLCLLVALLLSVPAYADLLTFSSAAAFGLAAPGLPIETFESGLVGAGGLTSCTSPLSGAAASPCFPLGGLLPGVVYSSTPDPVMVVIGAGFFGLGNTSKVLGPTLFASTMNITFTSANAVGFDVYPGLATGNILISVFSPAEVSLGSFTIPGVAGGSFFGVVSTTDLIGRVNIASQSASPGEVIDNLRFGTPTTVPEPSSLLLLAAGSAIAFRLRRRLLAN